MHPMMGRPNNTHHMCCSGHHHCREAPNIVQGIIIIAVGKHPTLFRASSLRGSTQQNMSFPQQGVVIQHVTGFERHRYQSVWQHHDLVAISTAAQLAWHERGRWATHLALMMRCLGNQYHVGDTHLQGSGAWTSSLMFWQAALCSGKHPQQHMYGIQQLSFCVSAEAPPVSLTVLI